MKIVALVLLCGGILSFLLGIFFTLCATQVVGGGINTQGTVTRHVTDDFFKDIKEANKAVYCMVEFKDSAGRVHEIRTALAGYPPAYNIGSTVEVAYLKDKPRSARIVTCTDLFGEAILSSVVSNLFLLSGVFIFAVSVFIDRRRHKQLSNLVKGD